MTTTIKSGIAEVKFARDPEDFFTGFLSKVAPQTLAILQDTVRELERDAQRDWPVRQPKLIWEKKRVVGERPTTQGSVNKFETGYTVTASNEFVAFVRNAAPYAWAIKMGVESVNKQGQDINLSLGARVANEVMFKPAKKQANRVAEALASDLTDGIKRS